LKDKAECKRQNDQTTQTCEKTKTFHGYLPLKLVLMDNPSQAVSRRIQSRSINYDDECLPSEHHIMA
jgi:hypothetical protein